jgi:hypothetical protein
MSVVADTACALSFAAQTIPACPFILAGDLA